MPIIMVIIKGELHKVHHYSTCLQVVQAREWFRMKVRFQQHDLQAHRSDLTSCYTETYINRSATCGRATETPGYVLYLPPPPPPHSG